MVKNRSTRGTTIVGKFAFAVLTIGSLVGPIAAAGQLAGGVFAARARDSFGRTNGFGAEAGVVIPVLPMEVLAGGTLFSPSCSGCDLKGWSLGMKFFVLPGRGLKPHITFGRTWSDFEDPSVAQTTGDNGFFGGAGLEIGLRRVGIFAEGRYDFLTEPVDDLSPDLRQWILRAGLVMRWGGLPL